MTSSDAIDGLIGHIVYGLFCSINIYVCQMRTVHCKFKCVKMTLYYMFKRINPFLYAV